MPRVLDGAPAFAKAPACRAAPWLQRVRIYEMAFSDEWQVTRSQATRLPLQGTLTSNVEVSMHRKRLMMSIGRFAHLPIRARNQQNL